MCFSWAPCWTDWTLKRLRLFKHKFWIERSVTIRNLPSAANVIFVESPVAVGYSYSNTTSDYAAFGDAQTGANITWLVNQLCVIKPELIRYWESSGSFLLLFFAGLCHQLLILRSCVSCHLACTWCLCRKFARNYKLIYFETWGLQRETHIHSWWTGTRAIQSIARMICTLLVKAMVVMTEPLSALSNFHHKPVTWPAGPTKTCSMQIGWH